MIYFFCNEPLLEIYITEMELEVYVCSCYCFAIYYIYENVCLQTWYKIWNITEKMEIQMLELHR